MSDIDKPEEPKKSEWTPEKVENLIKLVDTLAKSWFTFRRESLEVETKHNRRLTLYLAGFLGLTVVLMTWLTLENKVSGDALLFLVGTITGYVILFIKDLIFGLAPRPKPEQ